MISEYYTVYRSDSNPLNDKNLPLIFTHLCLSWMLLYKSIDN